MHEPNPEKWLSGVGPGWHGLVLAAIALLPEGSKVLQVKEKFGALRFYYDFPENLTDETRRMCVFEYINAMEYASQFICEHCGRAGDLREDLGWMLTLCDDCHSKAKEKRSG